MPRSSAATASSTSSRGANSSAAALYPSFKSTPRFYSTAYTREMAAALSAVTDSVHFAHTEMVNWTVVADDRGVMLIDAGYPGDRDDVIASLRDLGFGVD